MKVCPKCGYEDPPYWKHSRHGWDRQTDYCRIEDIKNLEPALYEILTQKGECDDGLYYYKLSKGGYVYRLLSRDGKQAYNKHGYTEHPKGANLKQIKLIDKE